MGNIFNVLERRTSTRSFLNKKIDSEIKNKIINASIISPTAGNMMLYSIIEVSDENLKNELSILCDNQPFIKDAGLILFYVTNPIRWYNSYNLINNSNELPSLADYYLGLNDAIIAAQSAVLAAEALDIGSCYIGDIVENYEKIKELFKLPKYVNPACLVVFGYKNKNAQQRPKRFNVEDILCENEFNDTNINAFKNKFINTKNPNEMAISTINNTFNRKIHSEFFKEMNRSLWLNINEYEE